MSSNLKGTQISPQQLNDALKQHLNADVRSLDQVKLVFSEFSKLQYQLQQLMLEPQYREVFCNHMSTFDIEKSIFMKAVQQTTVQQNPDQAQIDIIVSQSFMILVSLLSELPQIQDQLFIAFDHYVNQQLERQIPILASQFFFVGYILLCSYLPAEKQILINFDNMMMCFNQQSFTLPQEMNFLSFHKEINNQYSFLFSQQIFANVFERMKKYKQQFSQQNQNMSSQGVYVQCPFGDYVPQNNQQYKKAEQSNIGIGVYQELSEQVSGILNMEIFKNRINMLNTFKQKFNYLPVDNDIFRVLTKILVFKQLMLIDNSIFDILYQDTVGEMPITIYLMKHVLKVINQRMQLVLSPIIEQISKIHVQGIIENHLDLLIKYVPQDQSIATLQIAVTSILQIYSLYAQVGDFIYLTKGQVQYREVIGTLLNNMTAFDQLTSYNIKPVMQLISKCVSVDIGMVWQFLNENKKLQIESFDLLIENNQSGFDNLSYYNYLKELRQIILSGELKNAYQIYFATITPGDAIQCLCEMLMSKVFVNPYMNVQMRKQEQFYIAHFLYYGNEKQFINYTMQYVLSFLDHQDNTKIVEICSSLSQMVFNYAIPITRQEFLINAFPVQFWILLLEILCSYNLPVYVQNQVLQLLSKIKQLNIQNFFSQVELYSMILHKFQYILMYDKIQSGFILKIFQQYNNLFNSSYVPTPPIQQQAPIMSVGMNQNSTQNVLLKQDIRQMFINHFRSVIQDDMVNYKSLNNQLYHDYYNNLYSLIISFLLQDQNCRIVHFVGGSKVLVDNLLFSFEITNTDVKISAIQMTTLMLQFLNVEMFGDQAVEQLYQQLQQNLKGIVESLKQQNLLVLFGFLFIILAQNKNNCQSIVELLRLVFEQFNINNQLDNFDELQNLTIQSLHFVKNQIKLTKSQIEDITVNMLISAVTELAFVQVNLLLITQIFEVKLINQALSGVSGNLDFYLKNNQQIPRIYQMVTQSCQLLNNQIGQGQLTNVGFQQNIVFMLIIISVLLQSEESFMHPLTQLVLNSFQRFEIQNNYVELLYKKLQELGDKVSMGEKDESFNQISNEKLMTVLINSDLQDRTLLLTEIIHKYIDNQLLDQKGFECNLQVLSLFKEQIPIIFHSFKDQEKENEAFLLLEKMFVYIYLNLRFLRQNNYILVSRRQVRDIIVVPGNILFSFENVPELDTVMKELSNVIKQ